MFVPTPALTHSLGPSENQARAEGEWFTNKFRNKFINFKQNTVLFGRKCVFNNVNINIFSVFSLHSSPYAREPIITILQSWWRRWNNLAPNFLKSLHEIWNITAKSNSLSVKNNVFCLKGKGIIHSRLVIVDVDVANHELNIWLNAAVFYWVEEIAVLTNGTCSCCSGGRLSVPTSWTEVAWTHCGDRILPWFLDLWGLHLSIRLWLSP